MVGYVAAGAPVPAVKSVGVPTWSPWMRCLIGEKKKNRGAAVGGLDGLQRRE